MNKKDKIVKQHIKIRLIVYDFLYLLHTLQYLLTMKE